MRKTFLLFERSHENRKGMWIRTSVEPILSTSSDGFYQNFILAREVSGRALDF